MVTECFFCSSVLPPNEDIEHCSHGQRLAFDERQGRLWVVCRACGRWNLTPAEDRWEAIEECERRFRECRVRLCTDEIGMARLPSGLDLVRIGSPVLPEFAAWRYGDQLLRRRILGAPRRMVRALAWPGAMAAGTLIAASVGTAGALAWAGAAALLFHHRRRRPAVSVPLARGGTLALASEQIQHAELIRAEDESEQWAMWVGCEPDDAPPDARVEYTAAGEPRALLTGGDGRAAAALILPTLNPLGGDPRMVQAAVGWIQAVGGPSQALHKFARSRLVRSPLDNIERTLVSLHPEARLALEMSLHEEEEQRALRGELTILRWAWKQEETLASIADNMW
ncbi:MAG TPA: hypothetical protein VLD58_02140 [Gemmatimonadales bacterium]|nr:hypothetical protein [Gemmatimonadales bacterium]